MMKATKILLCLAVAMSMASCGDMVKGFVRGATRQVFNYNYEDSKEWGCVVMQELGLPAFDCVEISGAVKLIYAQDSLCHVRVHGCEKALGHYRIEVRDGVLQVKLKDFKGSMGKSTPCITLYVGAPVLRDVEIDGAGDVEFGGKVAFADDLKVELNGAGDISVEDISLGRLQVEVNGAGDVHIQKATCTGDAELEVNGAGDITANLTAQDIACEVNGAGDVRLTVQCCGLKVLCNGAGDATVSGVCQRLKASDDMMSSVNTKGLKVEEKQ